MSYEPINESIIYLVVNAFNFCSTLNVAEVFYGQTERLFVLTTDFFQFHSVINRFVIQPKKYIDHSRRSITSLLNGPNKCQPQEMSSDPG